MESQQHARTEHLSARRLSASLLLGLLIVAIASIAAGPGTPRPGVLHPLDQAGLQAADYLYIQAAGTGGGAALAHAVGALGLEVAGEVRDGGLRVRVPAGADARAVAARLDATGLVRSVEADQLVAASRLPVDPLYPVRQAPYMETIRATEAWNRQNGEGVVIAVIDTGVDYNHPELADRLFINHDEVFLNSRDDDRNGCVDDIAGCNFVSLATADPSCNYRESPPNWRAYDDEGHGTFVAGIVAATGDNGTGIAGVAWGALILPVKVLDCTATGRISDAAAGIRYAARMGADVINISFGTVSPSPVLAEAIAFARAQGSVVVASAGNDGRRGVTYPAAYSDVISVAASGLLRFDGLDYTATAPFANFGGTVDFLAPGVGIISTLPARYCGKNGWTCLDEGPYGISSGSSFATPIVAGAVALVIAQYPNLPPDFAVTLLLNGRRDGATVGDSPVLDIAAAMEAQIFSAGVPGTSRTGAGSPRGPAAPARSP